MHYQGTIYRPPSEANSILLQVTTGCSHNRCTFCGMYKEKRFTLVPDDIVYADIDYAAENMSYARRLFLCDGDALILPFAKLQAILKRIKKKLPRVERVGIYANGKNLRTKTVEELRILRDLGLGIIYMGLESGDNDTLQQMCKGMTAEEMITMGRKVKAAGIPLSITVLLGIAGKKDSLVHAVATGKALTALDPEYVGALSLMIEPGTPLHAQIRAGTFTVPEPLEILQELRTMIANTHLTSGLFHANHASNYLPIRAKLPEEHGVTLELIDQALAGNRPLKPEYMRAL
ncbi:MAG: radical SAM protein [Desulfobulbus sp.]|nr:radical SAM protein [Desulfobulbus sp.]